MPVTLTIKQVPEVIARRLRARASASHRSLQGELMAILEAAVAREDRAERPRARYHATRKLKDLVEGTNPAADRLTIAELWEMGRKAGLSTPSESTQIIRKARDGRNRR